MFPDNSADYEDDLDGFVPEEDDEYEARVWNLLTLINPGDEDTALRQFGGWRELSGGEEVDGPELLLQLKDVIDWTSGFHVETGDTETLMDALDQQAARWSVEVDWGGDRDDDEFMASLEASALLGLAYDRLREDGYSLWTWDAGMEASAGFVALRRDDDGMRALSQLLGIELRPGSDPF